jgi:MFS family permease
MINPRIERGPRIGHGGRPVRLFHRNRQSGILPALGLMALWAAVYAPNPCDSVIALSLCFATLELNEGPYWAATMYVARSDTMSATGILNAGGNLGGVIGIPIVAYLSGHGAWTAAFVIGSGFALLATVAWIGVDATHRTSD